MALRVYTMPISQPARTVSWACLYEDTEVEEVQVMPGKDTKKEEYRKKGPILTVPRLEEGDFVLNESHAILCYLGDKFSWKLYPSDAKTRARIHQYMHWHHANTRQITTAFFMPLMRPDIKMPAEVINNHVKGVGSTLAMIEHWLNASKWLCGDAPTIADLSCYCEVGQCQDKFTGLFSVRGVSLDTFPKIKAWLAECETLKGFEKSHAALAKMSPKIKGMAEKAASKL